MAGRKVRQHTFDLTKEVGFTSCSLISDSSFRTDNAVKNHWNGMKRCLDLNMPHAFLTRTTSSELEALVKLNVHQKQAGQMKRSVGQTKRSSQAGWTDEEDSMLTAPVKKYNIWEKLEENRNNGCSVPASLAKST